VYSRLLVLRGVKRGVHYGQSMHFIVVVNLVYYCFFVCTELNVDLVHRADLVVGARIGGEEESTSGISTNDSMHRLSTIVHRLDSVDNRDLHLQIHEIEEDNRRLVGFTDYVICYLLYSTCYLLWDLILACFEMQLIVYFGSFSS